MGSSRTRNYPPDPRQRGALAALPGLFTLRSAVKSGCHHDNAGPRVGYTPANVAMDHRRAHGASLRRRSDGHDDIGQDAAFDLADGGAGLAGYHFRTNGAVCRCALFRGVALRLANRLLDQPADHTQSGRTFCRTPADVAHFGPAHLALSTNYLSAQMITGCRPTIFKSHHVGWWRIALRPPMWGCICSHCWPRTILVLLRRPTSRCASNLPLPRSIARNAIAAIFSTGLTRAPWIHCRRATFPRLTVAI